MSIFPAAYFPCISYVAQFIADDAPVIEVFDTYHKQTYRNRCHVMTANGVQLLSVPVKQVNGNHTMTKDMAISTVEPWQQIHRRCLESAYKASPYFDHYYGYLAPIFEQRYERLVDLNDAALKAIFKMLKVQKDIVHTTDYAKEAENDFRGVFVKWEPNNPKPIDALRLGARHDMGFGALPTYYQVFENKFPFASDLSVLDLIFNEGPEALDYLRSLKG